MEAKKDALRVKIVRKFLDSDRQTPWRGALIGCLAEYGEGDAYDLCVHPPGKARSQWPPFFREVLEAWGKLLPHLAPKEVKKSWSSYLSSGLLSSSTAERRCPVRLCGRRGSRR